MPDPDHQNWPRAHLSLKVIKRTPHLRTIFYKSSSDTYFEMLTWKIPYRDEATQELVNSIRSALHILSGKEPPAPW
jgi:hypothetical protein